MAGQRPLHQGQQLLQPQIVVSFFSKPDKYFAPCNHMVLADGGKQTSEYSVKFKWKYEDQILTQIDI